jgi:hypothetical protein
MRACAETVRSAAVWADTTRPHPAGQEGVQAMVDISFRVVHEPGTTPFVDTRAFIVTYVVKLPTRGLLANVRSRGIPSG